MYANHTIAPAVKHVKKLFSLWCYLCPLGRKEQETQGALTNSCDRHDVVPHNILDCQHGNGMEWVCDLWSPPLCPYTALFRAGRWQETNLNAFPGCKFYHNAFVPWTFPFSSFFTHICPRGFTTKMPNSFNCPPWPSCADGAMRAWLALVWLATARAQLTNLALGRVPWHGERGPLWKKGNNKDIATWFCVAGLFGGFFSLVCWVGLLLRF